MASTSKQLAVQRLKAVSDRHAFIEINDLSKTFREGTSDRPVLRNITAQFNQGEFVVLLGQSGSGKSTSTSFAALNAPAAAALVSMVKPLPN